MNEFCGDENWGKYIEGERKEKVRVMALNKTHKVVCPYLMVTQLAPSLLFAVS